MDRPCDIIIHYRYYFHCCNKYFVVINCYRINRCWYVIIESFLRFFNTSCRIMASCPKQFLLKEADVATSDKPVVSPRVFPNIILGRHGSPSFMDNPLSVDLYTGHAWTDSQNITVLLEKCVKNPKADEKAESHSWMNDDVVEDAVEHAVEHAVE